MTLGARHPGGFRDKITFLWSRDCKFAVTISFSVEFSHTVLYCSTSVLLTLSVFLSNDSSYAYKPFVHKASVNSVYLFKLRLPYVLVVLAPYAPIALHASSITFTDRRPQDPDKTRQQVKG